MATKRKRARTLAQEQVANAQDRMLKACAFPLAFGAGNEFRIGDHGLKKIELATIIIAAGIRAGGTEYPPLELARVALEDAEAVLELLTKAYR